MHTGLNARAVGRASAAIVAALVIAGAARGQYIGLASPAPEVNGDFGGALAALPDVNGDGKMDIAVAARAEDPGASPTDAGRVHVYSGATAKRLRTLVSPGETFLGSFGYSVAGVPDVNGDGRGDILIGAPMESPGAAPANSGRAYLFSGATGNLIRQHATPSAAINGKYGWSVAGVGDVNGDGRGEALIGAIGETSGKPGVVRDGRARLYSGANGALLRTFTSPQRETDGEFGAAVAAVPDATGDLKPDIVIGAPAEDPGNYPDAAGRAYVYNGATGALVVQMASPFFQAGGRFGHSVAGVPDMSGDARGEVIVGAKFEAPAVGITKGGRAYLKHAKNGAGIAHLISPNKEVNGEFGSAVAGLNDTGANGKGDVVVGAWGEDPGASPDLAGRAYLVRY